MNIYILTKWVAYEGSEIIDVYEDLDEITKIAENLNMYSSTDGWEGWDVKTYSIIPRNKDEKDVPQ